MKKTKTTTIEISGQEIIRDYVCEAMDLTISEYNMQFSKNPPQILWDTVEVGSVDQGNYVMRVTKCTIIVDDKL